jgi:hypothetical protein
VRYAAALALLAIAATACGGGGPPSAPPDLVGVVEELDGSAVLVDDDEPEGCGAWFTPGRDVRVLREARGGGYEPAEWDALVVGRAVEVWIAPGTLTVTSCPTRSQAGTVLLTYATEP